jgi:N-acetylglucosaminyldiphosphoundecaprenol N-acetyl-beta-D-mannosaminyltransferase
LNSKKLEHLNFLNHRFTSFDSLSLMSELLNPDTKDGSGLFHFCSADSIVELERDTNSTAQSNNEFMICDSKPLAAYLKSKNKSFTQLRGIDFLTHFIAHSSSKKTHMLIGSTPTTLKKFIDRAKDENPNFRCLDSLAPPFGLTNNEIAKLVVELINESKPDIVWLGFGSIKQIQISRIVMASVKATKVKVVTIGAAFDFYAGTKRAAPSLVTRIYLEWLYRFLTEPRRLFRRYCIGIPTFLKLVYRDYRSL